MIGKLSSNLLGREQTGMKTVGMKMIELKLLWKLLTQMTFGETSYEKPVVRLTLIFDN